MGPDKMIDMSKNIKFCAEFCFSKGNKKHCKIYCGEDPRIVPWNLPSPPPPPPLVPVDIPLTQTGLNDKELFTSIVVIVSCVLGGAIILGILLAFLREWCYKRNNSRRRNPNPPILFATQEDFFDEEQGGRVIDHPIWYINTVGLQQSVIDLISVFKYKKDEGLIEGTDCSVCLGEFQEDEALRLLPKCSHAFHVSCIDTWLRSHKNCPLCRAPIINESAIPQSDEAAPRSEENRASDLDNEIESRTIRVEEVDSSNERMESYRIDDDLSIEEKNYAQHSGSLHDLGDNQSLSVVELQPVRRSASLDSFVDSKCDESSLSGIDSKRMIGNSSTRELMKSSSVVGSSSLQKESSGRFFFLSKSRRSQSSILPL